MVHATFARLFSFLSYFDGVHIGNNDAREKAARYTEAQCFASPSRMMATMTAEAAAPPSPAPDEDAAWALELEEELDLESEPPVEREVAQHRDGDAAMSTSVEASPASACASPAASRRRSLASELPLEVLVIIISFGQVGRVCKSWSLAAIARACLSLVPVDILWILGLTSGRRAVGRRRFSARLTEILRPLTPSAPLIALDVEAELHACYGQRCGTCRSCLRPQDGA